MLRAAVISIRGLVLLAFLVAMPLLALPEVVDRYDAWLQGAPIKFPQWVGKTLELQPENYEHFPIRPEISFETSGQQAPAQQPELPIEQPEPIPPVSVHPVQSVGDRFTEIPKQLQLLGANYLRLESLAGEELLYSFHCIMPQDGGPSASRRFEAQAAEPVEAMEQVLMEITAWKAGLANRRAGRENRRTW